MKNTMKRIFYKGTIRTMKVREIATYNPKLVKNHIDLAVRKDIVYDRFRSRLKARELEP